MTLHENADKTSATTIWPAATEIEPQRPLLKSMGRGALLKCPNCGKGALFSRYLKVADTCPECGEDLHHHRADDAPPYFTIFIVAHVIVSLLVSVELSYAPPVWLHLVIWLPLTVVLSLVLLPIVKGVIVGLQWSLRMHGFGGDDENDAHSI